MAKVAKKKKVTKKPQRRNSMWGKLKTQELEEALKVHERNILAMERKIEDLARSHRNEREDWEREKRILQDAANIEKKKFDDERALVLKTMELEFKGKVQEEVNKVRLEADQKLQRGIEDNFNKLKESLAKLHEEGNAQTKFTEQIALKMMETIRPHGVPQITEK
jgi:hypothetical protein